jgi:hypothetical protein
VRHRHRETRHDLIGGGINEQDLIGPKASDQHLVSIG